MFFSTPLLSFALLASTVFAVPASPLNGRIARRGDRHLSNLLSARKNGGGSGGNGGNTETATAVASPTATSIPPAASGAILTSTEWAGVGMESVANTYKSVTGTLVVPDLQPAAGGASSGYYGGSAWVGLDGITCDNLMAAGISFTYLQGTVTAQAWTEVYPNAAVNLAMTVNPGDSLKLTLTATSTTAGTAVLENLSSGESSTVSLTAPSPLCLENAEWIVEDFEDGTFLIPFADFGSITFNDASATTQSGSTVNPSGGHVINMVQSGIQFTSASSTGSSVTVDYLTSIPF
ncbi:peptidase A4 family-domain-containing protein [Mycena sanguinolenta]|nr:peptidase A4 family-domain-containing protein [Mycena sanguinolenta]